MKLKYCTFKVTATSNCYKKGEIKATKEKKKTQFIEKVVCILGSTACYPKNIGRE